MSKFFFSIMMKNNNHDALHPLLNYNPTIKLLGCLTLNAIIVEKLSKFMKLVEVTIVLVLRSSVDKRSFSMINFTKSKFRNHLTTHLDLVVKMHAL
jgi:hypothetical protein